MTTIYCSQKLEKFLGGVDKKTVAAEESPLGDWNGHSFHVNGKRCLLFLNSRTCYSLVITAILKKRLVNFPDFFRERLVRQLNDDFSLTEGTEILVRRRLWEIAICSTNNNRSVTSTMNQHVSALPHYALRFGPVDTWNDIAMSGVLNEAPVSAKVWANKGTPGYFLPKEATAELLATLK
jgi:hypothetical protein